MKTFEILSCLFLITTFLILILNESNRLLEAEQDMFSECYGSMPHLTNKTKSISPIFKLSKNRNVDIVIGISTTKREKVSYLNETLNSILKSLNDYERSLTLIVVLISNTNDDSFISQTIKSLETNYSQELTSGLLEVIVPPKELYPNLNESVTDHIYKDSNERIKWRQNQIYDYCYLMAYAQNRGKYYLQLEDDIITSRRFINKIKKEIDSRGNDWMLMEFSTLGFIGKLMKTSDLTKFINYFLLFSTVKPIDHLHRGLISEYFCDTPNTNECNIKLDKMFYLKIKPSLFQHIGYYSSLNGKIQRLKDHDFLKY